MTVVFVFKLALFVCVPEGASFWKPPLWEALWPRMNVPEIFAVAYCCADEGKGRCIREHVVWFV